MGAKSMSGAGDETAPACPTRAAGPPMAVSSVRVVVPAIGGVERVSRDHSAIGSFHARLSRSAERIFVAPNESRLSSVRIRVITAADQRGREPMGPCPSVLWIKGFEPSENRPGRRVGRVRRTWVSGPVGEDHGRGSVMSDLFSGEGCSL